MKKRGKTVLTTGQVAKICNVAPRTVSKWFDQGHLRGYRIPGSKDRRIPLDQLVQFMRTHGIPLEGLETGATKVLLLEGDTTFSQTLSKALEGEGGFEPSTAESAFEAGVAAEKTKPHVLVVDVKLPDIVPQTLARFIRSTSDLKDIRLIGIGPGLTGAQGQALLQEGFDAYLPKPFEMRSLIALMEANGS